MSRDIDLLVFGDMAWSVLNSQRSLCRLRGGLITLSHLEVRRSAAQRTRCIFCDEPTLSPTLHVLCRCKRWAAERADVWMHCGDGENAMFDESGSIKSR